MTTEQESQPVPGDEPEQIQVQVKGPSDDYRSEIADNARKSREKLAVRDSVPSESEYSESSEPEEPEFVRVKVYGEEREVSREEVDAAGGKDAYELTEAARVKFEQAKRQAAELQERLREVDELRGSLNKAEPRSPELPELTEEQEAEIDRLREEYPDDIADTKALAYRIQNALERNATVPSADMIAEKASSQALAAIEAKEREKQSREADAYFAEHYGHIQEDPELFEFALTKARTKFSSSPERPAIEVVKEVGDEMNGWLEKVRKGTGDDRLARKKSMHRSPRPAQIAKQAPKENKPPTKSEVIAGMRKARGLS